MNQPIAQKYDSIPIGQALVDNMDIITQARTSDLGLENAKLNQSLIDRGQSIKALRNKPVAKGEHALVIAAGPSMKRTDIAEQLSNSDFNGAIIATESALLYCLRNKIIPDLVVTLDPHHSRIVRWFGDPDLTAKDIEIDDYFSRQDLDQSFTNELLVNKEITELINKYGSQIKIALSTSASPKVVQRALECGMSIYWWNPMYDDPDLPNGKTRTLYKQNGLPCINAGGNVGSASWMIAQAVLNKKHIALTGMDFGYYAETPYENTQYYKEAVELVGHTNLDDFFIKQFNPHLKQWFYTDPAYMWYKNCFLEMVADANCITYNCTGGGILFGDDIRFIPLSDFFSNHANSEH